MKIITIGVDPGESCGVAVLEGDKLIHVWQGSEHDALTLVELIISRAASEDVVMVACERYTIMQHGPKSHQPHALKMVGALQRIVERDNALRAMNNDQAPIGFVLQGPAEAHAIVTDTTLRRLGWWQTGGTVDQRDAKDVNMAIRHALLSLSRNYATLFDALLRGAGE